MIIGILILISIVVNFYRLASEYGRKNQWLYSVAGVAAFYAGFYAGVFALAFICFLMEKALDEAELTLMSLPMAFIFCAGLHYILKRNWKKKGRVSNADILDDTL